MPKHNPNDFFKKSLKQSKRPRCLKKLKFFCQMCEKQCEDQVISIIKEWVQTPLCYRIPPTPNSPIRGKSRPLHQSILRVISFFNREFEHDFLENLRRRYGENPIVANQFYQDFIKDPSHVHMNATKVLIY